MPKFPKINSSTANEEFRKRDGLTGALLLGLLNPYRTKTKLIYFEFAGFLDEKYMAFAISVETVQLAKYGATRNQSEHSKRWRASR